MSVYLLPHPLTRMFFVRAPNRGCGLITTSGMYAEFATGPRTCHLEDGLSLESEADGGTVDEATKSPTPMSGKQVIVGATSPGRRTLRIRLRRRRILRSTLWTGQGIGFEQKGQGPKCWVTMCERSSEVSS